MFYKVISFFSFIFVFLLNAAVAETIESQKETLTQELMQKSGLNVQIQNSPDELNAIVEKLYQVAPGDTGNDKTGIVKQLNSIIISSFEPGIIKNIVARHIKIKMSSEEIGNVLTWLDSPLGKKITKIEEEASTAESYKNKAATLPLLQQKADYEVRVSLMEALDDHFQATESTLDRWLHSQLVYRTAVLYAFPAMDIPSTDALIANFEIYKNAMRKQISSNMAMSFLYTYRHLELEEINRYINFIKSDYGENYHRVVIEGRAKAEMFCRKKFGQNVGKVMAEKSNTIFNKPDLHTYPQEK